MTIEEALGARGIALEQTDGGFYATGRYRPRYPESVAFGRTRSRALRNLRRQFAVWVY